MKKILFLLALICSTMMFATPRQISGSVPSSVTVPVVHVTVDGKTTPVTVQSMSVTEIDSNHIRCTIYGDHNSSATTILPISFDTALDLAYDAVKVAHKFHLINDSYFKTCVNEYRRLKKK